MKIEALKMILSKFGNVQICKADLVFVMLLTGTGLSKFQTFNDIQELCLQFCADKYPIVEAIRNEDSFFCMVLKPKT